MTIDKAFKDVYSNLLEEYGYQYCAKLKRFVKVVNNELVFFIGLKKVSALRKGNKAFTIKAGISSIYFFYECFKMIFDFNEHELQVFSPTRDYGWGFDYNEENILEMMEKSAEITKELVIPVLENVKDLKIYVRYAKEYNLRVLKHCDVYMYDSLVLIITNNHDDFMELLRDIREDERDFMKERIETIYTTPRDNVYKNPKLLKAAYEEAEKRKKENLKMLEVYKINI